MSALSPALARVAHALRIIDERNPILARDWPLATVSESNAHAHWRKRQARAAGQHSTIRAALADVRAGLRSRLEMTDLVVLLVRSSARELDSDNLAGALKHVRDAVAWTLGVDDRSPRVTWLVDQAKGPTGVRLRVYSAAQRTDPALWGGE